MRKAAVPGIWSLARLEETAIWRECPAAECLEERCLAAECPEERYPEAECRGVECLAAGVESHAVSKDFHLNK